MNDLIEKKLLVSPVGEEELLDKLALFDENGNRLTGNESKMAMKNYWFYKRLLLFSETMFFFYFLTLAIGSIVSLVADIEIPGGFMMSTFYGIPATAVISVIGYFFLILYLFACYKFMKHGDEQLDELLSNTFCIFVMVIVTVSLFLYQILLRQDDGTINDQQFKRTTYITMLSYGLLGTWLMVTGLFKHNSVSLRVTINQQLWSRPKYTYNATIDDIDIGLVGDNDVTKKRGRSNSVGSKDNLITYHAIRPKRFTGGFISIMFLSTINIIALITWLLIVTLGKETLPNFSVLYKVFLTSYGINFVVLIVLWLSWNLMSNLFKGSFTAHFDSFCSTHLLFFGVLLLSFVSYNYRYNYLPSDLFPSSPDAIEILQKSFFSVIISLSLVLLPLVGMGIGKGCCIMMIEWPVNVEAYSKFLQKHNE